MWNTMSILRRLKYRWNTEGGYGEVLYLAFPLIISTGTWSVQHFVDRMFLTWYSPEAIAAAMPAGMLSFTISCLFIGTASYVGTFVAQYYGAGHYHRCGPALWQGIYLSLIGGAVQLAFIPAAAFIFHLIGHAPEIAECERVYFIILCGGGIPAIAASAMAAFFSGLGKTLPVMWINIVQTIVNLFLDWIFVFGRWGIPEMGIAGAGIATVSAYVLSIALYFFLLFKGRYSHRYHSLIGWRFEKALFIRLVRFGFPSGVQFFIEIAGFTCFIVLIGRLGTDALAASNIAFNINTLAFMPMLGTGIAVSVLTGQHIGEHKPHLAERTAYSAFHLTFLYMGLIAVLYVVCPDLFIKPFAVHSDPVRFGSIRELTVVLLRFVAFYSLFDTLNIIFSSAVKGAGDTRFVMTAELSISMAVMVVPSYIAIVLLSKGIYTGWVFTTAHISILGIVFYIRFLGGKWKSMRVIEERVAPLPPSFPEAPAAD